MDTQLNTAYFFPHVLQAVPTDDYAVFAYMNDGSVRKVDIKPMIRSGTVFAPLQDIAFFKERLTVINDTVAWDMSGDRNAEKCVDIDPVSIFDSPNVDDPLAAKKEP